MKILFVIGGLQAGGAESQVILLSKELVRRGHRVGVYVLSAQGARVDALAGSAVELTLDDKRGRIDLGVIARLRRYVRRFRPDIVHGFKYDGNLYARIAGRIACLGARVPVLGSERTDDHKVALGQRIGYRLTGMLSEGIVANTCGGAQFARRLHRLPAERVDVLWNGVDLEEVAARVAKSARPARQVFPGADLKRICVVASLKPENDYPLALRVLRRLADRDPSWRLVCAGEEPRGHRGCRAELLAERDRLQLAPFAQFVGHRSDVLELIADSDVLLITALRGGFPNVALEAMASGTVVVSTDYSDLARILPLPEQLVGSRSEHDIAAALLRCHADRARIAAAQRRWVEAHADAAASAAALLRLYSKYTSPALRLEPV
jgi:glycosyltransferase involved in cell wall biosynthesis